MPDIDQTRRLLAAKSGSLREPEFTRIVKSFGFAVRAGSNGKHMVVAHVGLSAYGFTTWNYNGGHGEPIKQGYISEFRRLLDQYREPLKELKYAT